MGEEPERIVVGVDGSDESRAALRFAFEEARLRKARLQVIHAWTRDTSGWYARPTREAGSEQLDVSSAERTEPSEEDRRPAQEQQRLQAFVARLFPAPEVEIDESAVEGKTTEVLLEAAGGADLLVVGSRGRGGFAELLLGSVSQQCASHAPCPVAIVRSYRRRDR